MPSHQGIHLLPPFPFASWTPALFCNIAHADFGPASGKSRYSMPVKIIKLCPLQSLIKRDSYLLAGLALPQVERLKSCLAKPTSISQTQVAGINILLSSLIQIEISWGLRGAGILYRLLWATIIQWDVEPASCCNRKITCPPSVPRNTSSLMESGRDSIAWTDLWTMMKYWTKTKCAKKQDLVHCICCLLDQSCKLVSLNILHTYAIWKQWQNLIWTRWMNSRRDLQFLSHLARPHLRGFGWYLDQMWALLQATEETLLYNYI